MFSFANYVLLMEAITNSMMMLLRGRHTIDSTEIKRFESQAWGSQEADSDFDRIITRSDHIIDIFCMSLITNPFTESSASLNLPHKLSSTYFK